MVDSVSNANAKFDIEVKGQKGQFSKIGLGTCNATDDDTEAMVCGALKEGYRMIDTALLYGNQVGCGKGIKASGVPREEIEITSKVAFFPENSAGVCWYNANNEKGGEEASIDLCLEQLGVDYIDLMLVHSPVCTVPEYKPASMPHFFELWGW